MPEPKLLLGLYEGQVTNRSDPEGLGRVKVMVEGVVEPESPNWAEPIGSPGSGHSRRGHFEPPRVGANVAVFFKMGEPDYPRYFAGPWGAPAGVSDLHDDAVVEGEDRQNAVTEDEEWTIERDSRTTRKIYRVKHRNSSLAVLVDADNDKVFLVREAADQALVRGTEYRTAEVSYLGGLQGALATFASAVGSATTVPQVAAAGTALDTALGSLPSGIADDATAYLSEKAFTE